MTTTTPLVDLFVRVLVVLVMLINMFGMLWFSYFSLVEVLVLLLLGFRLQFRISGETPDWKILVSLFAYLGMGVAQVHGHYLSDVSVLDALWKSRVILAVLTSVFVLDVWMYERAGMNDVASNE